MSDVHNIGSQVGEGKTGVCAATSMALNDILVPLLRGTIEYTNVCLLYRGEMGQQAFAFRPYFTRKE